MALKVLHIGPTAQPIPPPAGGAIERRMWFLACAQARAGAEVSLMVAAGESRGSGVNVVPVGHRGRFPLALAAARHVRRLAPDVVHLHSRPEPAVLLRAIGFRGLVALQFDFPLVFGRITHRVGGAYGPLLRRLLEGSVDLFLPVSDFAARSMGERGVQLPAGKTRILWNGVELERPRTEPPPIRHTALYVGRYVEQKGADLFAAAAHALPDWDFVAAGPLGDFARPGRPGPGLVGGRVRHLGRLPDADIVELMRTATCLVLPTRRWEMFGMVLIEALAQGTPVVAPASGGPPEVLRGAPATHFFSPGRADSLVEAIVMAASDGLPTREAAREFATRFAWRSLADTSLVYYETAIHRKATE